MTLRRNWWRVKQKHKSTSPYPKSLTKCFITTGSNTEELIYQSLLYHCDLSSIFFYSEDFFLSDYSLCAEIAHYSMAKDPDESQHICEKLEQEH